MYFEGLDSEFCEFLENKVLYNYHVRLKNIFDNNLFHVVDHDNFYEVHPLFNYETCVSSNPKDHIEGNTLILQKNNDTLLTFESSENVVDYIEVSKVQIIDDIKYTLFYTYNRITNEPAPFKMTSAGKVTDKNGYFLDSEVV